MNMKEKNAKKSKIHQLGFSFLKRESNYWTANVKLSLCVSP